MTGSHIAYARMTGESKFRGAIGDYDTDSKTSSRISHVVSLVSFPDVKAF